jgi:tripartite-type tricarboxylate transporter receptor subunit TctC
MAMRIQSLLHNMAVIRCDNDSGNARLTRPAGPIKQGQPIFRESGMIRMLTAAIAALLAIGGPAAAQDYPNRPITMVIPFAAGGPTDVLGRVVAARMSELLGQQIVIENIGGAGGMLGANRVKTSPPDGYQIVLGTVGTHAQAPTLSKKPLYNAATDFQPVALLAEVPIVLIARKDLPVSNIKEFVEYTRKNQEKMSFASSGVGAAVHLGTVLLNSAIGVTVTHVPYKGSAPAMQDLQGGRIDYMTEILSTGYPQIQGGAVKAIALLSPQRSKILPDLPTAREGGVNVDAYTWNAIFLPKGTPEPIVKKLNDVAMQAMKTPAVREKLEALGVTVVTEDRMSVAYLDKFLKDEIAKWGKAIADSGAQTD